MPVELTEEEKAKFSEHLKELGYDDHAKKVIERVNNEAKSHREAREKAEAELKKLADAEAARKAEDEKRKSDEEAERKKLDDEKKSFGDRLSSIEQTFAEKLAERDALNAKKHEDLAKELAARDHQILMQAVRSAARERGILDQDLVELLDVSKIPIDGGIPSRDAISALIEEHASAKPHLYKDKDEDGRTRDDQGRFTRPDPSKTKKDVDWSKLSDKEFAEREAELRRARV